MRFIKMHGAKNDYIFVDTFSQRAPDHPQKLAVQISDRHAGVGADGLVLIEPSATADARMRMWNADGSEGQMCGNALRCIVHYLNERQDVAKKAWRIETGHGILQGEVLEDSSEVRVEMGVPVLKAALIPTQLNGDPPLDQPIALAETDASFFVSSVSMGNPHCVVFVPELSDTLVQTVGPQLERHTAFPQRTNVEFVRIDTPEKAVVRVWERGSGETMACGTGACAVVVAGVLTARLARQCEVHLPGGILHVDWQLDERVFVTGPVSEVFYGDWPV